MTSVNLNGFGLLALTHALVTLVALAVTGGFGVLFVLLFCASLAGAGVLLLLFRETPFFAASFSTLTAVYASVFAYFLEDIFGKVSPVVAGVGFSVPIAAFTFVCLLRRAEIRTAIARTKARDEGELGESSLWLVPVALVGIAVGVLSIVSETINSDLAFLLAMVTIGGIVTWSSRRVAMFLVDVALLFEEFAEHIQRLVLPAFAFLTVYGVIVILFAAIYTILSQWSPNAHFNIAGIERTLSFPEAVYFSVVTLSTVGYGDIMPVSNLARALASVEVVSGVLLLLFGFSELISYARGPSRNGRD